MSISPWSVGQLSPTWTLICVRDNGTAMDLSGVTPAQLSLVIYNSTFVQTGTGAGTFTVLSASSGWVNYTLVPADVTTAATYYVRVVVDFGGRSPDMSDYIQWVIQP